MKITQSRLKSVAYQHIGAKGFFRFFLQYFLRYFLRFAKNIANFYTNFCNPQKISQIFAIVIDLFCLFLRYFLQYFLRSAKNTAIFCVFICALQNISQIFAVFFTQCKKYRQNIRFFAGNICGIICFAHIGARGHYRKYLR